MTPELFIKAQLASMAHREAYHLGGINNMLAVAFVLRNRQRASWHGGNWMSVIQLADSHSAVINPQTAIDLRDSNFKTFLQQIDDVYSGLAPDRMTEGALFYCELHRVESTWFRDSIIRDPANHPRCANVGQMTFFR